MFCQYYIPSEMKQFFLSLFSIKKQIAEKAIKLVPNKHNSFKRIKPKLIFKMIKNQFKLVQNSHIPLEISAKTS